MSREFRTQSKGITLSARPDGRSLSVCVSEQDRRRGWYGVVAIITVDRARAVRLRDFLNEWIGEDDE